MTQWSARWTTTTGATGDAQTSYTQANDSVINKILAGCSNYEGVAPGYLNALAITTTGANVVQIDTGAAVLDGKVYLNDAASTLGVASAVGGGNTRIDRVVLRADWAGTDIALALLGGTDGAIPTVPDLAATPGTTYDLPLAQVLVGVAGVSSITDERTLAYPYSASGTAVLVKSGGTAGTMTVATPAGDGLVLRRSGLTMGFGEISGLAIADNAVDSEHYAADSIDTEHYAPDSVDVAALAAMVPGLLGRQGGSATDWSTSGTNDYESGIDVRIQCGSVATVDAMGVTIAFPVAFSAPPIVVPGAFTSSSGVSAVVHSISTTQAKFYTTDLDGNIQAHKVHWIAIGPE